MKKNVYGRFALVTLVILFLVGVGGCKKPNTTKIKVAEVAHSIFYAPQYAAMTLGYFEEEGLTIELINANGADKVTAALLSNDVQIGLQGPEPTIYLYNQNKNDYLINFAQVTRTDGSFIFGREAVKDFNISMLAGKSILGGRKGGVPEMTLEYALKKAGLTVIQDANRPVSAALNEVNVRTDVAFAAMAGSFLAGEGDFTTLFEPTATSLVNSKKAYLLASVGELAGDVSFTAYSTSAKYFANNQDILEKFTRALYRGQQFIQKSDDLTVAKAVQPFFTDISLDDLVSVTARYRSIDAWCKTPVFSEAGFERLMDVMIMAKELDKRAPFKTLVDLSIAQKVVNEVK